MNATTETAEDVRMQDNLTDWQWAALNDTEPYEEICLIQSWKNSPYNGKA